MKDSKYQKKDYRSSAFIGCLMLFVGIAASFDSKSPIIDMITIIGAIGLIGQSIYQYQKQYQL